MTPSSSSSLSRDLIGAIGGLVSPREPGVRILVLEHLSSRKALLSAVKAAGDQLTVSLEPEDLQHPGRCVVVLPAESMQEVEPTLGPSVQVILWSHGLRPPIPDEWQRQIDRFGLKLSGRSNGRSRRPEYRAMANSLDRALARPGRRINPVVVTSSQQDVDMVCGELELRARAVADHRVQVHDKELDANIWGDSEMPPPESIQIIKLSDYIASDSDISVRLLYALEQAFSAPAQIILCMTEGGREELKENQGWAELLRRGFSLSLSHQEQKVDVKTSGVWPDIRDVLPGRPYPRRPGNKILSGEISQDDPVAILSYVSSVGRDGHAVVFNEKQAATITVQRGRISHVNVLGEWPSAYEIASQRGIRTDGPEFQRTKEDVAKERLLETLLFGGARFVFVETTPNAPTEEVVSLDPDTLGVVLSERLDQWASVRSSVSLDAKQIAGFAKMGYSRVTGIERSLDDEGTPIEPSDVAHLLAHEGLLREARQVLEGASARTSEGWYLLGWLRVDTGDTNGAEAAFQTASQSDLWFNEYARAAYRMIQVRSGMNPAREFLESLRNVDDPEEAAAAITELSIRMGNLGLAKETARTIPDPVARDAYRQLIDDE